MIKRKDPYSGELFVAKRTNQRFASRENQIAYNNAKAKKIRDKKTEIDNQISKNWQILSDVLGELNSVTKTKEYLLGCGYNFKLFNNQRIQNNNIFYGVYDFGLRKVEDGFYEIVKFATND